MITACNSFTPNPQVSAQRQSARRGFSFTEILFAVMILGIGFIMVAAMFPVAIRQTQDTAEESTTSSLAKQGASVLGRIGSKSNMPYTNGIMLSTGLSGFPDFWTATKGNLICPSDSRYAWVPFYSVGNVYTPQLIAPATTPPTMHYVATASPYAQIIVIGVTARNKSSFDSSDLLVPTLPDVPNLRGRPLLAQFTYDSNPLTPDTVTFSLDPVASPKLSLPGVNLQGLVTEGMFVIVADDTTVPYQQPYTIMPAPWAATIAAPPPPTSCDGYIYRVGRLIGINPGPTYTFELMPGNDMKSAVNRPLNVTAGTTYTKGTTLGTVKVLVVGAGYANPGAGGAFSGPAMDVSAYTTFIKLN